MNVQPNSLITKSRFLNGPVRSPVGVAIPSYPFFMPSSRDANETTQEPGYGKAVSFFFDSDVIEVSGGHSQL